jgi:hypothetical protein
VAFLLLSRKSNGKRALSHRIAPISVEYVPGIAAMARRQVSEPEA